LGSRLGIKRQRYSGSMMEACNSVDSETHDPAPRDLERVAGARPIEPASPRG